MYTVDNQCIKLCILFILSRSQDEPMMYGNLPEMSINYYTALEKILLFLYCVGDIWWNKHCEKRRPDFFSVRISRHLMR